MPCDQPDEKDQSCIVVTISEASFEPPEDETISRGEGLTTEMATNQRREEVTGVYHGTRSHTSNTAGSHEEDSNSQTIREEEEEDNTELQQIQGRIHRLQKLHELREKEKQLRKDLDDLGTERTPKRRRYGNESDTSSDGRATEIKIHNITKFTQLCPLQKRDDWLNDLERAFSGAPRKYRERGQNKVILALDNMDADCRARWARFLDEQDPITRQQYECDWEHFKEWSLSLIKDAANRDLMIAQRLENAKQREDQHPQDFHNYLDSLEKHFPKGAEKVRAYTFYTKLQPSLRASLGLHGGDIPETREGVVSLATRYWDTLYTPPIRPLITRERIHEGRIKKIPYFEKAIFYKKGAKPFRKPYESNSYFEKSTYHEKAAKPFRKPHESNSSRTREPSGKNRVINGKILRCYTCNSDEHLSPACPQRNTDKLQLGKGWQPKP